MPSPPASLRLSNRSILVAVAMVGTTLVVLRVLEASTRVLGWLAVAVVLAGLLHPLVNRTAHRMPRGAALLVVMLGTVGFAAGIVYLGVDAVTEQADRLQDAAPRAAAVIERDERFGEAAREFELREKVQSFVDELPNRLRGGTAAEALRANATRGVAFLATAVLTLFLVGHGPRLVNRAVDQVADPARRRRLAALIANSHRRWSRYLALVAARAVAAGLLGWAVARSVGLPAAVLMGMIVGFGSFLPSMGLLLGAIPMLLFAAADDFDRALLVLTVLLVAQVGDAAFVQRHIERRSLHVGPVLTLVSAMIGFELYGLGGVVVAFVAIVFLAAVVEELAPTDDSELLSAADVLLPLDEESQPGQARAEAEAIERTRTSHERS